MNKYNSKPALKILAFFTFITAVLVSYFTIFQPVIPLKVQTASANSNVNSDNPLIKFSSFVNNNYYYNNNSIYLYIDIDAQKIERVSKTPLNISVVIDRSGSMSEKNKLDYVKKAVNYIIDETGPNDYISIVTYDDNVDVLQRINLINNKFELKKAVNDLKPGGFTNLSGGLFEGYDQINYNYKRGYVNKVFLLSDGIANRGITDRFELSELVKEKTRRDGITISTFGVGNDFNENLMTVIAEYGNGNYYYIKNSADIPEIFAAELNSLKHLLAQSAKIKVRFPNNFLKLSKVYGYDYVAEGENVVIDLKDIYSGQKKSVLLKFDFTRNTNEMLKFESELIYIDVENNFKYIAEKSLNTIDYTIDKSVYNANKNIYAEQNIAMFEANELMEEALRKTDDGNYNKAKDLISGAKKYINEKIEELGSTPELKKQSENIRSYDYELETIEQKSAEEKNELQKSKKYDNYRTRKKTE